MHLRGELSSCDFLGEARGDIFPSFPDATVVLLCLNMALEEGCALWGLGQRGTQPCRMGGPALFHSGSPTHCLLCAIAMAVAAPSHICAYAITRELGARHGAQGAWCSDASSCHAVCQQPGAGALQQGFVLEGRLEKHSACCDTLCDILVSSCFNF